MTRMSDSEVGPRSLEIQELQRRQSSQRRAHRRPAHGAEPAPSAARRGDGGIRGVRAVMKARSVHTGHTEACLWGAKRSSRIYAASAGTYQRTVPLRGGNNTLTHSVSLPPSLPPSLTFSHFLSLLTLKRGSTPQVRTHMHSLDTHNLSGAAAPARHTKSHTTHVIHII